MMKAVFLFFLVACVYSAESQEAANSRWFVRPPRPEPVQVVEQPGQVQVVEQPDQVQVVDSSDDLCGPNEHYNNCGSSCPVTCTTPANQACILRCHAGCHCNVGYVRNHNNRCILRSQCPNWSPVMPF